MNGRAAALQTPSRGENLKSSEVAREHPRKRKKSREKLIGLSDGEQKAPRLRAIAHRERIVH